MENVEFGLLRSSMIASGRLGSLSGLYQKAYISTIVSNYEVYRYPSQKIKAPNPHP